MTRFKLKKNITRKNLANHNIFYDADVFRPPCLLPGHVDAVREALLSFDNIVPGGKGWKMTFEDELKEHKDHISLESADSALPPDAFFIPVAGYQEELNERSTQWHTAHTNMKSCVEVTKSARKLEADMEDGWTNFWRQNTFTVVSEKTKDQPGFHPVLDKWSLEGNCSWTEFDDIEPCDLNLKPRTLPKPDLAYAFPVVNRMFKDLKGAERDEFSRCFSLEAIQMLAAKDTISTVTTGLRRSMDSTQERVLSTADRACFPWAVVEVKKQVPAGHDAAVKRCYCQAANAAAAAIALRAQLFDKVVPDACSTMPPVIAFTCCGPEVRVWLMYYTEPDAERKRARRMVCIWSTSVLLTWGVASLRAIIMNMHTWASRILKPRIQACIYEILQRPEYPFISRAVPPLREPAIAKLSRTPRSGNSTSLSPCRSDNSLTLLNMDESPCRVKRNEAATITHPTTITSRLASSPFGNPVTSKEAPPGADFGSSQNLHQNDTLPVVSNPRLLFGTVDRLATQNQHGGKTAGTTELDCRDDVAQIITSLMATHLEDRSRQKSQPNESVDAQVNIFEKQASASKSRNPTGSFGQSPTLDRPASDVGLFGNGNSTPKTTAGLFNLPTTASKTTGGLFSESTSTSKTTARIFSNPTTAPDTADKLCSNPTSTPRTAGGPRHRSMNSTYNPHDATRSACRRFGDPVTFESGRTVIDRSSGDEPFDDHASPCNGSKKSGTSLGRKTCSKYPVLKYPTKDSPRSSLQGKQLSGSRGSPGSKRMGTSTVSYKCSNRAEEVQDEDGSESEHSDLEEAFESRESPGAKAFREFLRRLETPYKHRSDHISREMRGFMVKG